MVKKVNLTFAFDGCDPMHTKWYSPQISSKKTIKKELNEAYSSFVSLGDEYAKLLTKTSLYRYTRTYDEEINANDAVQYTLNIFHLSEALGTCNWICNVRQRIDSSGKLDPNGDTYYVTRTIELQKSVTDDVLDLTCILKQNVRREIT